MRTIPWWSVDLGPEAPQAALQAIQNRQLSMGAVVALFEQRMAEALGVPHVVAVCSGSSALMLALLEAGVQAGDEVIVPNRTWIATAHAAHLLGARVVLVDVEKERPVLDPDAFTAAITPRTRCVIPVHLNGRACDMVRIRAIAEQHGITVIEDAAQALLSVSPEGGYLGTHSRSGCFSLSVAKLITCGQGGFIVTADDSVAQRLRLMRTHGTGDVIHAQWNFAGGNFRFTDILASVALTQLDTIQERKEKLVSLYATYAEALLGIPNIHLLPIDTTTGEIPLYVEVLVEKRNDFMAFLRVHGIQSRPLYPSLNEAPQFAGNNGGSYPNSAIYAKCALFLPSGPDQKPEDIAFVLDIMHSWSCE